MFQAANIVKAKQALASCFEESTVEMDDDKTIAQDDMKYYGNADNLYYTVWSYYAIASGFAGEMLLVYGTIIEQILLVKALFAAMYCDVHSSIHALVIAMNVCKKQVLESINVIHGSDNVMLKVCYYQKYFVRLTYIAYHHHLIINFFLIILHMVIDY